MNKLKFAVTGLMLIFILYGCSQNSVFDSTPDKFALIINQFEKKDIGNNGLVENCGKYYLNPPQNTNSYFASAMQTQCNYKMEQLANYLQKTSDFSNVTSKDLQSQKTWKFYFKSQYAIGKIS